MALRAVHDYEEAAVRDNSVRQVASEPYAYYAARDLQPGDEVTSAFGAGYWLTALERHEPRPATRLLLCIAKAQYARLSQGVDGVSACARLREATGDTITFVFSTKAQAILLRGGENGGGERQLGGENSGEGLGETGEILREMSELQAGLLLTMALLTMALLTMAGARLHPPLPTMAQVTVAILTHCGSAPCGRRAASPLRFHIPKVLPTTDYCQAGPSTPASYVKCHTNLLPSTTARRVASSSASCGWALGRAPSGPHSQPRWTPSSSR